MKSSYYILAFGLLTACSSGEPSTYTLPTAKPVFDIPALAGKNIDQVKNALGKPIKDDEPTDLQLRKGVVEWDKSFKRDSIEVLVTYNAKTRVVKEFFISNAHGPKADVTPLFTLTNLKEKNPGLKVVGVPTLANHDLFTGIKVSEENK